MGKENKGSSEKNVDPHWYHSRKSDEHLEKAFVAALVVGASALVDPNVLVVLGPEAARQMFLAAYHLWRIDELW